MSDYWFHKPLGIGIPLANQDFMGECKVRDFGHIIKVSSEMFTPRLDNCRVLKGGGVQGEGVTGEP